MYSSPTVLSRCTCSTTALLLADRRGLSHQALVWRPRKSESGPLGIDRTKKNPQSEVVDLKWKWVRSIGQPRWLVGSRFRHRCWLAGLCLHICCFVVGRGPLLCWTFEYLENNLSFDAWQWIWYKIVCWSAYVHLSFLYYSYSMPEFDMYSIPLASSFLYHERNISSGVELGRDELAVEMSQRTEFTIAVLFFFLLCQQSP